MSKVSTQGTKGSGGISDLNFKNSSGFNKNGGVIQLDSLLSALKDALLVLPILQKFFVLIWLAIVIPLYNLNFFLLKIFRREKNKPLKKIDENVWMTSGSFFFMFKLYPSYMMVIKGKDGSLLIYNPIELQPETLNQIQGLGPVGAIFIANHFHDNWALDWKNQFPNSSIYTIRNMKSHTEKFLHVDSVIEEDADMCENFGILRINDISAMMRPGILDYFLSIETMSKKSLLVLPHISSTEGLSIKYWVGGILGYSGMGYSKINSLVYTKDISELKEYTAYIINSLKPNSIFCLHGKPLETEKEITKFVNVLKN